MPFVGASHATHTEGYSARAVEHFDQATVGDTREVSILGLPHVTIILRQTGGTALGTVSVRVTRRQGPASGIDDSVEIDSFPIPAIGLAVTRTYHVASRAIFLRWHDSGGGGTLSGMISAAAQ